MINNLQNLNETFAGLRIILNKYLPKLCHSAKIVELVYNTLDK